MTDHQMVNFVLDKEQKSITEVVMLFLQMAPSGRLERSTVRLEGVCSIQLS